MRDVVSDYIKIAVRSPTEGISQYTNRLLKFFDSLTTAELKTIQNYDLEQKKETLNA